MTYSFRIPRVRLEPELLRDAGATYRPIRLPKTRAWLAWRGRAARGVTVSAEGESVQVRWPGFCSSDDVRLAMDLAVRLATSANRLVDVEDVPPDVPFDDALEPPGEGETAGQWCRPEQVGAWPLSWHDYQFEAAGLPLQLSALSGKSVAMSGATRGVVIGPRVLARCSTAAPSSVFGRLFKEPSEPSLHTLLELFVSLQHDSAASRETRPRFLTRDLPTLKGREPSPSPWASHILIGAFAADGTPLERGDGDKRPHFVTAREGDCVLLPDADYVALESGADAWPCVRFADFARALPVEPRPFDECTWVVDVPHGAEWAKLLESLGPRVVSHVPFEDGFRSTVAEIAAASPEGQRDVVCDLEMELWSSMNEPRERQDWEAVARIAERWTVVAPDVAQGWYHRSRARLRQGRPAEALQDILTAAQKAEPVRLMKTGLDADAAEQLANAGRPAEALAHIERALRRAPSDWELRADAIAFRDRLRVQLEPPV